MSDVSNKFYGCQDFSAMNDEDIQSWLLQLKAIKISESGGPFPEPPDAAPPPKAAGGDLDDAKVITANKNLAHSRTVDELGDIVARIQDIENENEELQGKLAAQETAQGKVFGFLRGKLAESEEQLHFLEHAEAKARRRLVEDREEIRRRLKSTIAKGAEEVAGIQARTDAIRTEVDELRCFEKTVPRLEERKKELLSAIEKGRLKHRQDVEAHAKKAETVGVELHEKRKAEISVIEAHARSTVMMRLGDKTKAKIQQNLVVAAELDQQSASAANLTSRIDSVEAANKELRRRVIDARAAGERVAKHFVTKQHELRSAQESAERLQRDREEAERMRKRMAVCGGGNGNGGGSPNSGTESMLKKKRNTAQGSGGDGGSHGFHSGSGSNISGWKMLTQGGGVMGVSSSELKVEVDEATVTKLREEAAATEHAVAMMSEQLEFAETDLSLAVEHQDEFVRVILGAVQEHQQQQQQQQETNYSRRGGGGGGGGSLHSSSSSSSAPHASSPPPKGTPANFDMLNGSVGGGSSVSISLFDDGASLPTVYSTTEEATSLPASQVVNGVVLEEQAAEKEAEENGEAQRRRREVLGLIIERLHRNQVEHFRSVEEKTKKKRKGKHRQPSKQGSTTLPAIWSDVG